MICCHSCPFHPVNGYAQQRCPAPVCAVRTNSDHLCIRTPVIRCFLDTYTVNRLYQLDTLALQLAESVFKKALLGRDRALILALFHAAPEELRQIFWNSLEQTEPRSIWLLNPIFSAAGLMPVSSFASLGSRRSSYLQALAANPYAGGRYKSTNGGETCEAL